MVPHSQPFNSNIAAVFSWTLILGLKTHEDQRARTVPFLVRVVSNWLT